MLIGCLLSAAQVAAETPDGQGEPVLSTDALVLQSRMNNSIGFVTDRAYDQGWNYQRYARSRALEKALR